MVWHGKVWYGTVCYGKFWYGKLWYGKVSNCKLLYSVLINGMVKYGIFVMALYGMFGCLQKWFGN